MNNFFKCPNCGNQIELTDAIKKQVENEMSEKYKNDILLAKKETEEKTKLEIEKKSQQEVSELKNLVNEKENKLNQMRTEEIKLREERRLLEEKSKEMEIVIQRKIDEERKKVEYEVLKRSDENHRLKDMEKEKQLSDAQKTILELQRQLSQGSQQTQGEVLELDLENTLKTSFPQDVIEPVEKGVKGADLRQIVKSTLGTVCGVILWESKRTKSWTDEWLIKLKDDLRAEKADIPVIVSSALPKEAENGFGLKEGVWIVNYGLFLAVATILRKSVFDVARQKAMSANQGKKADLIYEFITGNEFKQQIEAIVEAYKEMSDQIIKERIAYEKIWKNREGQLKRLMTSTINIYGGAQGLIGASMPLIKGLELLQLEENNPK